PARVLRREAAPPRQGSELEGRRHADPRRPARGRAEPVHLLRAGRPVRHRARAGVREVEGLRGLEPELARRPAEARPVALRLHRQAPQADRGELTMAAQGKDDFDVLKFFITVMALLTAIVAVFAFVLYGKVSSTTKEIKRELATITEMDKLAQDA